MNKISELRKKTGTSQSDLAKLLGITRQAISLYEKWPNKGGREPKLETWKKLADHFGVSVAELMGVDDYMKGLVDSMDSFNASFEHELEQQLDAVKSQVEKNELSPKEQANLAKLIKIGIQLKKYGSNNNIVTEIDVVLRSLNNIINNTVDDDDDYQDTIDIFTKLVNNLKEQNKKASDD
ncbi:helix-turn-helix transcriptional regulator [Leuconostoc citreum]|uniref:helix-turn-helix transcriptional regulator n=1 Tax=Leuconostoc citreum TaxID=33964 RepID=UPI0021822E6E|nr:helix-turn-helix domain-containing protein [Leuconostoc citreum]MCS8587450.1 XRE family transcriptional regulator [Leuconostoc citreum]MCS8599765.1 XRE family transcriptional regulator [Leuconostoc citreum]